MGSANFYQRPLAKAYGIADKQTRSQIQERSILGFLGIILGVLRLKVSVYNVYMTNQFQTTFAQGGGGSKIRSRGDIE